MRFKFRRKPLSALLTSLATVGAFVYSVVHFYDVPLIDFGNIMVVAFLFLFLIILASIVMVATIKLISHLLNRRSERVDES